MLPGIDSDEEPDNDTDTDVGGREGPPSTHENPEHQFRMLIPHPENARSEPANSDE
jgi:hypothetical protein